MKENTTAELARELYLAVKDNDIVRLKELFQDPVCTGLVRSDNKFLCTACSAGFVEVVRLLLEEGSEINSKNSFTWTPLHWACSSNKGRVEIVRSLIEAGCDVNAIDGDGQTPLHKACWLGRPEIVRLLLDAGADVNARVDDGRTPLHWACTYGMVDLARLLLSYGADPNARNDDGNTPLHWVCTYWACTYGRVPIARLLLDHGADVNAVNGIGQDSFDLATHKGTTADGAGAPVIPILLAYGATPSEDKLERVFQTAVCMDESNPNRGPILTWYQENRPELYFSTFCTMEIGPGM